MLDDDSGTSDQRPAPSGGPHFRVHTIDGEKFDGNIGQVVLLNKVEEWKIENRTGLRIQTVLSQIERHIFDTNAQLVRRPHPLSSNELTATS